MIKGSCPIRSWTGGSLPALTRSASIGASLNVLGYWAGSVMTVAPSSLPTSEVLGLAAAAGAAGLAASVGFAAAAGAAAAGAAGAVVAAGAAGAVVAAGAAGLAASAGFAGAE